MPMRRWLAFTISWFIPLLPYLAALAGAGVSANCPRYCTCRWRASKEIVECVGVGLSHIPVDLSKGTQVLDLSRNSLKKLEDKIFVTAGLLNLHRLSLQECRLTVIKENAFANLTNLVELDLSANYLMYVPSDSLVACPSLRRLFLNDNHIRNLEDRSFAGVNRLSVLEIAQGQLSSISSRAFLDLNHLTELRLDGNRLVTLPQGVFGSLTAIRKLEVHGNPWTCDCHLREFYGWIKKLRRLPDPPTVTQVVCDKPQHRKSVKLIDLPLDEIACLPIIKEPLVNATVTSALGENVTFTCKVRATPSAWIEWRRPDKLLNNNSIEGRGNFNFIVTFSGQEEKQSNLTIKKVSVLSRGVYKCIAGNKAGDVSASISLEVVNGGALSMVLMDPMDLYLAGGAVGIVLFIALIYCIVLFVRKGKATKGKVVVIKKPGSASNAALMMNHVSEMRQPVPPPPKLTVQPITEVVVVDAQMKRQNDGILDGRVILESNHVVRSTNPSPSVQGSSTPEVIVGYPPPQEQDRGLPPSRRDDPGGRREGSLERERYRGGGAYDAAGGRYSPASTRSSQQREQNPSPRSVEYRGAADGAYVDNYGRELLNQRGEFIPRRSIHRTTSYDRYDRVGVLRSHSLSRESLNAYSEYGGAPSRRRYNSANRLEEDRSWRRQHHIPDAAADIYAARQHRDFTLPRSFGGSGSYYHRNFNPDLEFVRFRDSSLPRRLPPDHFGPRFLPRSGRESELAASIDRKNLLNSVRNNVRDPPLIRTVDIIPGRTRPRDVSFVGLRERDFSPVETPTLTLVDSLAVRERFYNAPTDAPPLTDMLYRKLDDMENSVRLKNAVRVLPPLPSNRLSHRRGDISPDRDYLSAA